MLKFIKISALIIVSLFIIAVIFIFVYIGTSDKWILTLTNSTHSPVIFNTNYCDNSVYELKVPKNSSKDFSCYTAIETSKDICVKNIGCTTFKHRISGGFLGGPEVRDIKISTEALIYDTHDQWHNNLINGSKNDILELVKKNKSNYYSSQYGGYLKHIKTAFQQDQDILLEIIKQRPYEFNDIYTSIPNKKGFLVKAVKANPSIIKYLETPSKKLVLSAIKMNGNLLSTIKGNLKHDEEIVLAAVSQKGVALKYASVHLKANKEIVMAAVKQSADAFYYAHTSLKKDKEIALVAVSKKGYILNYVDDSIKDDKELVLAAVKQNIDAIQFTTETLQNDKDVLALILEKMKTSTIHSRAVFDTSIKNNKAFLLAAIKNNPVFYSSIYGALKKDKEITLAAVSNKGALLRFADPSHTKDREVVLAAVKNDSNAIWHADPTLQKDEEILLLAINSPFITDDMIKNSNNKKIVMAAITNKYYLVHAIKQHFKNDKDIMLKAIEKDHTNLIYASLELRKNKAFSLEAVKINGLALEFVGSTHPPITSQTGFIILDNYRKNNPLKHDKEIVSAAIRKNGLALRYAPALFRRDKLFVYEAYKQNKEALIYAMGTDVKNEVYNMK